MTTQVPERFFQGLFNSKKLIYIVCFIILISTQVFAQTEKVTVTGKILDDTKQPIPGAVIVVKGTTDGTITEADGTYSISVPSDAILVISNIGSVSQEIPVDGRTSIDATLVVEASEIEEVVVVGYGTQTKKSVVGALSKINGAEVNKIPVASLDAQLQGKSSGLQINNNSGVPGDAVFVRVRGTTSVLADNNPLYIIDGVFISNTSLQTLSSGGRLTSPLADINPADIESMEVLKDASATSIYGARGANGVIIITTKRGDYNAKPKVTFDVSQGVAWASKRKLWKLADGPTNAQSVNDNYIQTQIDLGVDPAIAYSKRPFRPASDIVAGTPLGKGNPEDQQTYDRLGRTLRNAKLEEYSLSVQGGTKTTKYFISAGYSKQQSILKVADFERAGLKLNLDQKISDKVTVGISNGLTRTTRHMVGAGDGSQGNLLSSAALVQATYNPIYNADGTPSLAGNRDNVDVLIQDTDMKATSTRYIGNLYLDAQILRNLKFRSSWSTDIDFYDEKGYWSDRMLQGSAGGSAQSSLSQSTTWINEQTLSYRKNFGAKHSAGILIGNSIQGNGFKNSTAKGSGFPSNAYKEIAAASVQTSSTSASNSTLASFFARVDYNYDSKYFIEGSIRADGSSRFGPNRKWGYFPSLGAAWRIKEENFLKESTLLSELKLRASVGLTGNQNGINDDAWRGLWTGNAPYADNGTSGYKPGTAPFQLKNEDLHWEQTRQINAGFDIGFFNRINLEFNVYNKYTTEALLNLPLPQSSGYTSYLANAGEVSNKGFEIGINTVNVKKKDLTWTTNFNISRNWNKVEKLAVPITYYSRDWIRLQEGESMYSFWLYKQLYVDPQTGDAVYEDVNGDGQITVADRQILGSALPKYFGGITNTVTYKGFDVSLLFTYQWGNKIWNHNRFLSNYGGTRSDRSLYEDDVNYWKKPGDITDVPRFTSQGNNWALEQNSRLLEDGSFLRLKSLTIGYTVPKSLVEKYKLQGLRVYVSGTNLWLWSKYSGPDPESNVSNASQQIQGIDFGTPPQPTSIQGGITVTL